MTDTNISEKDDAVKGRERFIDYEPAECWIGCAVPDCPYHHTESWSIVNGLGKRVAGPFRCEKEAVAALSRQEAQKQ